MRTGREVGEPVKNKVQAAQQEDALRRLVQMVLMREGFSLPGDRPPGEEWPAGTAVISFRIRVEGSGSTAPPQVITMAAPAEEILRYTGGLDLDEVQFGRLAISYRAREATVAGRPVPLTTKEFELLAYMAYHRNLVLTRSQLLAAVWEVDYAGSVRTVDGHVKCLRQKLGEYGRCLVTVRNVGYMFRWEDTLIG